MTTLDQTAAIQKPSFRLYKGWIIWGCAALFYCYQFMLRVSPSIMAEDLMRSFHVDACSLGILSSLYYNIYATLQIPVGSLMDHFRPRRMMTMAALLCGLGCICFAFAETVFQAGIGRFLIGAGSAFALLSCIKLGTIWFAPQKLPLVVGLTLLLGTLGAVSASTSMTFLVELTNWRTTMIILAFVGLGISLLGWTFVRDFSDKCHISSSNQKRNLLKIILEIMSKKQNWFIGLYGLLMYVTLSGFAELWGILFLTSKYHVSKAFAGFAISTLFIGIGLGAVIFPFICKYFKAFKPSIFISAFGAFLAFSAILYLPSLPFWMIIILLSLCGLFLGGQFLAYSMICNLNPTYASGTAGGFLNALCMVSGIIAQPLIGYLLELSWSNIYKDGIPIYSTHEFTIALSFIPCSLLLAIIIVPFIQESFQEENISLHSKSGLD